MRINRSYLMGLGTGLILSAILTVVVPLQRLNPAAAGNNPQSSAGSSLENTPISGTLQAAIDQNAGKSQGNGTEVNQSGAAKQPPTSPAAGAAAAGNGGNAGSAAGVGPGGTVSAGQSFLVPAGASAENIATNLVTQGLLADKKPFLDAVEKRGVASKFQAGVFNLLPGLSVDDLINKLLGK